MARTTPVPDATNPPPGTPPAANVATGTPPEPHRQHMLLHMKLDPTTLPKDALLARRPFIEKAAEFSAVQCGRDPQLAMEKWARVLHGLKSPCTLVDPEMYLASVTNWTSFPLDALQGYIRVPLGPDRSQEYRVKLPDVVEGEPSNQHCFLLCIKRFGQVILGEPGAKKFWSHNLVVLETEEVDPQAAGMAFVYSFDVGLNSDGALMYETASMYLVREDDPTRRSGRKIVDDRTNGLQIPTNFMGIVTECARDLGFPLEESRVNRRTAREQQEARMVAQVRALTPSSPLLTPPMGGGNGVQPAFANPLTRRD